MAELSDAIRSDWSRRKSGNVVSHAGSNPAAQMIIQHNNMGIVMATINEILHGELTTDDVYEIIMLDKKPENIDPLIICAFLCKKIDQLEKRLKPLENGLDYRTLKPGDIVE